MFAVNTVVVGDCLDVMAEMPDECVDLVYADIVYDSFDFSWLEECVRVLKRDGSIYVQTKHTNVAELKIYMDRLFIFRNWIIWCYKSCPERRRHYQRRHGDILFYVKSDIYTWNSPVQEPSSSTRATFDVDHTGKIINPTPAMEKHDRYVRPVVCRDWWDDISATYCRWDTGGKKQHKWQKPEKLLERIIRASSNPGDLVFDPFLGSGTTAVVARRLGRRFYGCDISSTCIELTNTRLSNPGASIGALPGKSAHSGTIMDQLF